MNRYIAIALIISGIVHLAPAVGVLGAPKLQSLYGVMLDDPDLVVLMRHRAVLFGLIGGFALIAAFKTSLQLPALVISTVSVVAFLAIAWPATALNAPLLRVFRIDVALAVILLPALALNLLREFR